MPNKGPIFQDHHTIEQQTLKSSRLLQKLSDADLFEMHAAENRIFLPADPKLAHDLGITPHSGGPIGDYQFGVRTFLEDLERTTYGRAALAGDPEALKRVAARVELFRDTMKAGLINGDLNTNAPLGMSADDIRPKVQSFFGNPQSYSQTYVQQIDSFKSLSNTELNWSPIAHSETRLLSTLQYMGQSSNNLTKGGDPEIGRQSLTQAVTQAHASGRLTLSEQGILQFEQTFGEEAASPFRVPRGQRGFISPELLIGDLSLNQGARVLGTLGIGIDGYQTARRANEFLGQDNATAANARWAEFGARTTVNVGGGAAAMAAGVTGVGPWTLVAVDLVLLDKAVDKGIALWQNEKIISQVDNEGVEWRREGKYWIREDLRADLDNNPHHAPASQKFSATIEKERELNYKGSHQAVEQALDKVPTPRNPLMQPVSENDPAHWQTERWRYSVEREQWSRMVADTMDREGAPEWTREDASPERTAQLNAQALQTIDENLSAGPAAIAMQYQFGHKAYGYCNIGDVPMSVASAMTTERLQASDERFYTRDAQGTWMYGGVPALPERALELDLTHARLQSAMQGYETELAKIPEWTPPTPEEIDRAEFRRLYINRRINPDVRPDEFEAAYDAAKRTRAEHGLGSDAKFALGDEAAGKTIAEIEIKHTRMIADKEVGVVAVTTPSDIAAALRERPSLKEQESAPQPNAPEQEITQATPEQRDAREQAQREANRQGLSRDEAQQAVQAAAASVPARGMSPGGVVAREAATANVEETSQAQREPAPDAPTPQITAQAAAIQAMMEGPRDPDTVYPGDRNDQVALLQYRLDKQGYRGIEGQPLPQNGHYDLDTLYAVAKFQHERQRLATGIADPQTVYEIAHAQPVRVQATDSLVQQVSPPAQQASQPEAPRHGTEPASAPEREAT